MGSSLLLALTLGLAPDPSASSPTVALRWNVVAPCPGPDDARRWLDAYLARWSASSAERHSIEIAIEREGVVFVARVLARTPRGRTTRRIRSGDCAAVAEGAVLVAAAAVAPVAVVDSEPLSRFPVPVAVPVPSRLEPPVRAVEALPVRPEQATASPRAEDDSPSDPALGLRGVAEIDTGLSIGLMPGPTFGAGLALGLRGRSFRVTVGGRALLPPTRTRHAGPGARVDGWLVGPAGCWIPARGRMELPLCVGAAVGQARAEGTGVAVSRTDARLLAILEFQGGVALRLGPHLTLATGLRAGAAVWRARFEVRGAGEVYRIPPVSLEPFLGLAVEFP